MQRVLEPELMDGDEQSRAYARADFSASNQRFVDGLVQRFRPHLRRVVDLGCGPGDIDIRLARAVPEAVITAVDGSAPMLTLARQAAREAGLDDRVTLVEGVLPGVPLEPHTFDALISKDLLHHLPQPAALWGEVIRLGRRGAAVYVMDLIRPDTSEAAHRIVDTVAGDEDPILRQDFFNSLCAAFTIEEVTGQLRSAGLHRFTVSRGSDRHLLVEGVLS